MHVRVPDRLLLHKDFTWTAKLLWMVYQLTVRSDGPNPASGLLENRTGLARHTVLRGLSQLASAGWLSHDGGGASNAWASVPGDLLLDKRLRVPAKLLYGMLQLTPSFRDMAGQFKYSELSGQTSMCANTLIEATRSLQEAGWLRTAQQHKYSPVHFALRDRESARQQKEVTEARRRLTEATFLGEALMREYLSLVVNSDDYEDDASPGFLVNPYTGREIQLDRYYPARVAFEFNGPQHYGPTNWFSNEEDFQRQSFRDALKVGICTQRGIQLLIIHPPDLSLERMQEIAGKVLPIRDLQGQERLIAYLESVSYAYRRKVLQGIMVEAAPENRPVQSLQDDLSAHHLESISRS